MSFRSAAITRTAGRTDGMCFVLVLGTVCNQAPGDGIDMRRNRGDDDSHEPEVGTLHSINALVCTGARSGA